MGSAISSSAKPGSSGSCSSSSIIEYPELEWAVVSSDESSRSHVLRLAASSLPLYPLDGQPEHGQFTNHMQLKLHYYIWYPTTTTTTKTTKTSSSSSSSTVSGACCCCSGGSQAAPAVCASAAAAGFPAILDFPASQQQLQQQHGELCVHCKRERVVGSKGVVLLLHGYQSHARFSWLRRWTPPLPAKRDPRVFGYLPHEQINHTDTKKTKENKKIKETEETPETKETKETVKTAGEKETGDPNAPDGSSAAASPSANGCGSCLGCMGSPQYSGSFIEALNALGFLVAALDAQSQGLSEGWQGRRGGMRHIDDLAEDILQFIHVIRRLLFLLQQGDKGDEGDKGDKGDKEPQDALDCLLGDTKIPFFLVGSSLGGWAAARAVEKLRDSQAVACAIPALPAAAAAAATAATAAGATEGGDGERLVAAAAPCLQVKGLVLLSPMFEVEAAKGGWRWTYTRPVLQQLAAWAPHTYVSKNADDTRFMAETEHRKKDLLYIHQGTRARTALEMLSNAEVPIHPKETEKIKETVCSAVLVAHNALDEQCGIRGAIDFYRRLTLADKTLLAINAVPPEVSVHSKDEQQAAARGSKKFDFQQRVSPQLQEELKECADISLVGLDVHHSFASEPDGNVILGRVLQWLQQHSS